MGTHPEPGGAIRRAAPCGRYRRGGHSLAASPAVGEERTKSPRGRAQLPAKSGAEDEKS